MSLFDPREMLKIAVKDEETGIAFYRALAGATRRPDIKAEVLAIGKQEEGHAERFRKMLAGLGGYKPMEEYGGQYDEFLKALVESRAFPSAEAAAVWARGAHSDAEAIELAIRLEKDTLSFLNEIKQTLPPTDTEVVSDIITEERNHLMELSRLRRVVKDG